MLERADFSRDLHFLTRSTGDTLDYTGSGLHEGSKLIWASAGEKRRELGLELRRPPDLPQGFSDLRVAGPGLLLVRGPAHTLARNEPDPSLEELAVFLLPGRGGSLFRWQPWWMTLNFAPRLWRIIYGWSLPARTRLRTVMGPMPACGPSIGPVTPRCCWTPG